MFATINCKLLSLYSNSKNLIRIGQAICSIKLVLLTPVRITSFTMHDYKMDFAKMTRNELLDQLIEILDNMAKKVPDGTRDPQEPAASLDRTRDPPQPENDLVDPQEPAASPDNTRDPPQRANAVSYTHLTLPTKRIV